MATRIDRVTAEAYGTTDPDVLQAYGFELEPDAPTEKLDRVLTWGRKANFWQVRGVAAVAAIFMFFLTWWLGNLITSVGYNRNDWLASAFAVISFALAFLAAIVIYVMVANTLNPPKAE